MKKQILDGLPYHFGLLSMKCNAFGDPQTFPNTIISNLFQFLFVLVGFTNSVSV